MLKKILVAFISMNICFSSMAYAQYEGDTLTAEEIEIYMSTVKEKEKTLPTWVKVSGGIAALLAVSYGVKKVAESPRTAKIVEPFKNTKVYQAFMKSANIEEYRAAKSRWELAKTHKGAIKSVKRGNYVGLTRSLATGDMQGAKQAKSQIKRAKALLKKPQPKGTLFWKAKKAGKWGVFLAVTAYVVFHDSSKEETTISNNREALEREIRTLMQNDIDALALYIYNLNDEQKRFAYSILAENPEIYEIVKQQIEEALSEENINAAKEIDNALEQERAQERAEELLMKKNEVIDSLRQSEEDFTPSWSWDY